MALPKNTNTVAPAKEVTSFSHNIDYTKTSPIVQSVPLPPKEVEEVGDIAGPKTEEQATSQPKEPLIFAPEAPIAEDVTKVSAADTKAIKDRYDSLNAEDKRRYDVIKKISPQVKALSKEAGLHPAFIISQMMQESGYSGSSLTGEDHNWGGIKDHHPEDGKEGEAWNKWYTNEHFSVKKYGTSSAAMAAAKKYLAKEKSKGFEGIGNKTSRGVKYRNSMFIDTDGTVKIRLQQPFKKYKTSEEGMEKQVGFYNKNKNPRYGKAGIFDTEDPYEQLKIAKEAGYATHNGYIKSVSSIIDSIVADGGKFKDAYNGDGTTGGFTPEVSFDYDQTSKQLISQRMGGGPSVIALGGTEQAKKFGESKYDTPMSMEAFIDLDETRAQRQTFGDKFANGIVKFGGKTATNVVGGIVGTAYGLGSALVNVDKSKFFDNDFAHMLDDVNESMDEKLPHYYTQAEMDEENLWKKMGSSNFMFDSVLNGFSFLAGAVITEAAATMLTAGVGSVAAWANITARAARTFKRFDRTRRMASLASGYNKVAKSKATWDALKVGRQLLTGASYESGVEARAHQDLTYNALKNDWIETHPNQEMPESVEAKFRNEARDSANAVMLGNMALVGGSNMLMLGKLYGPGIALRRAAQKFLPSAKRIGKNAAGKAIGEYASLGRGANAIGMGAKTQAVIGKSVGRAKAIFGTALYEGAVEEAGQSIMGSAMLDYSLMSVGSESKNAEADLLSSFAYGFSDTYKGTEGQSEIALGIALSMIGFGSGSGARGRYKSRKEMEVTQDKIAVNYNKYGSASLAIKNASNFMRKSHELHNLMDKAEASGNIGEYKNLENANFFGYVKSRYDAGYFEDIKEDAEAILDMSNEEFIEFFGYTAEDFKDDAEVSTRKSEVAESAIKRANRIKEALDLANRSVGSQVDDEDEMYTNEKYIAIRDRIAYQLATAEDSTERTEALTDKLTKLSNGKIIQSEGRETSTISLKSVDPETGEMVDKVIDIENFTESTLPAESAAAVKQLERATKALEEDAKLGESDPEKLSAKEVEGLEEVIAGLTGNLDILEGLHSSSKAFQIKDLSKLTREELGFLSTVTDSLSELREEDPALYEKNIEEIVEILQDLRHLRARKQTAFADYNELFTEEGRDRYYQKIERFVDDENKEAAFERLRKDEVPDVIKQLFEQHGPNADFYFARTRNIKEYEAQEHLADEKGKFIADKEYILRFTPEGEMYVADGGFNIEFTDEGIMKLVDVEEGKTVASNLVLTRVVTDAQKKAIKTLAAIDKVKSNKKGELTKLKAEIEETYDQMIEAMSFIESQEDVVQEGNSFRSKKTGRFVKGVKDAWSRARDVVDTAEELIATYEAEGAELLDSMDYLEEIVGIYYNPRTQSFDENMDSLYGQSQVDRNLALLDLGADRGILDSKEKAKEFAQTFTSDIKAYVAEVEVQTSKLRTSIEYLEDYKDVLEKVLLDRLRATSLPLNRYARANTLDEMFADVVNAADDFINSEEGTDEYLEKDPKDSSVSTMRTQLDILKELKNYKEYRSFMRQNPGFFLELQDFLGDLDAVEVALEEMRFLRSEIKITDAEIASIKADLGNIKAQQEIEEGVKDKAEAVLESLQFESMYEEIEGALTQIEEEVLLKRIEAEEKGTIDPPKGGIISGVGPISDNAHLGEKETEGENVKGYRGEITYRSYIQTGFNRTTSNPILSEANRAKYGTLDVTDGVSIWTPREENTEEENKWFKNAVSDLRFEMFNSVWRDYSAHVLKPVHSGNVPDALKEELEDLFVETEHTVDGAHIRAIVYKKVGNKLEPVYENEKEKKGLIVTTLALPTTTIKDKNKKDIPRFIEKKGSEVEDFDAYMAEIVESHKALRKDILDGKDVPLSITGSNIGYISVQVGKRFPVKGRLATEKSLDHGGKIHIATNVVDPKTGESLISGVDRNFKVRAGAAYYKHDGNMFPLKMRSLGDLEVNNILLLLQKREIEIDAAVATGSTKKAAVLEAESSLKEEGVDSTISQLIANYIYNGKLQPAQQEFGAPYQFYFDAKAKLYRFGLTGTITSDQIRKNEPEAMEALRAFLLTKTHQINNSLLHKKFHKKGAKLDTARRFEEVILNDDLTVDKKKSKIGKNKHATYERYLLEGDNAPLGTAVITKNKVTPQVRFKHLAFSTTPTAAPKAKVREEANIPDAPDGMEYTTIQKDSIANAYNMFKSFEEGQKFIFEDDEGPDLELDPSLKNLNRIFEFEGEAADQAWKSIEQAMADLKVKLADYSSKTYVYKAGSAGYMVSSFIDFVSYPDNKEELEAGQVIVGGKVENFVKAAEKAAVPEIGNFGELIYEPEGEEGAEEEIKPTGGPINIYAGAGQRAELSNFAKRPFNTSLDSSVDAGFDTVEGAFQAHKLLYSDQYYENKDSFLPEFTSEGKAFIAKLQTATGGQAKSMGREIKGLDVDRWDAQSENVMRKLLTESFEQNPEALEVLLDTGNATLTHTQDRGKWGRMFPTLLMDVRETLAKAQGDEDVGEIGAFRLIKEDSLMHAEAARATTKEVAKEEADLKKMYPNMDIKRVAGFLKTKDGYAQGQVSKFGEILLSDMAEFGTGYHEAFHHTSLFMLDASERAILYNEVRANSGKISTYKGETKEFTALTDREAEEYLAEEFRRWIMTDGKHKIGSTKVKTIFQKMVDILKLILGKLNLTTGEVDPNFEATLDIFTKIREGSFAQATPKALIISNPYNSLIKDGKIVSTIGNLGATQTTDVVRSFHKVFIEELLFNPESPYTIADLEKLVDPTFKAEYSKKSKAAYIRSIHKLVANLGTVIKDGTAADRIKAIKVKNQLRNNSNKWVDLVTLHKDYMTSIGVGNVLAYEDLVDDEYARVKDSASNMVDAMEYSAKDSANAAIKILVSSLPSGAVNESMTEGIVNYTEAMDFLQETLVGTQSFTDQVNLLKSVAYKKPWVLPLLDRISASGDLGMASFRYADVKLRIMFFQQFAKTKNDFLLHMVNAEGEIYSVDTNKQRLNRTITEPWRGNMLAKLGEKTSLIVQDKNSGKAIIDVDKKIDFGHGIPKSIKDIYKSKDFPVRAMALKFLGELGVEFTNPARVMSAEIEPENTEPNGEILNEGVAWLLKEIVAQSYSQGTGADLFSKNLDVQTRLGNLIKLEAIHNNTVVELQHFNPEGKVVYGITLNTYLSLVANAKNLDTYLNPDENLYCTNSEWRKRIKEGEDLQIVVLEGMKIDKTGEKGTMNSKLTGADQRVLDVAATLQGVAPFLRAADQGVEYGIRVPGSVARNFSDVTDRLLGYFEDEVKTAVALNKKGDGIGFKLYRDGGKSLRIFKDIVNKGASPEFTKDLADLLQGKANYDKFMMKWGDTVVSKIEAHLQDRSTETFNMFNKYRMVDVKSSGVYTLNGISIQTAQSLLNTTDAEFSVQSIHKLADIFVLNDFMNSVEQTKMFMGDPSFYKALFKRTKGAVGTGKITNTDPELDDWLNAEGTPKREDGKEANGFENVNVYQDPIAKSFMYDEYFKYIGEAARDYLRIEEADAQGYAILGAYRELSIRVGSWTDIQESIYEKSVDWKPGDVEISSNDLAHFPPLKPQYFGPQKTGGTFAPFFMKFSLAPLFPQMLHKNGSPTLLNSLYQDMIGNEVGITMFESGVKAGSRVNTATGKASTFYNKEGNINTIDTETISIIDYRYMKMQLDIDPKVKTKVTAGTQLRSIVLSDMFEGGVPIDYDRKSKDSDARKIAWSNLSEEKKIAKSNKYKLLQSSNSMLNAITSSAKHKLLKEFSLEQNNDGSFSLKGGDFTKFAELMQKELAKRTLPRNMSNGIQFILDNMSAGAAFDTLSSKDRMESMLYSLVANRIVRHKFKGDMKVQVSSTGTQVESRTMYQDGDEYRALTGSEHLKELKVYRKADPSIEGSQTLGMDVLLPHFFKEFVGQDLTIKEDGIYDSAGRKVGDNSLLELIGFRTPTEALYSVDFINVAGFLPKSMGSAIVIPSELVIKAGGDFDIDKLSLYMPSYKMVKGVMQKSTLLNGDANIDGTVSAKGLREYYDDKYEGIIGFGNSIEESIRSLESKKTTSEAAISNLMNVLFGMDVSDIIYSEAELEVIKERFSTVLDMSEEAKEDVAKAEYARFKERLSEVPSFKEFSNENTGRTPLQLESAGALQNSAMDTYRELLSSPDNYEAIITPLSLKGIEKNALEIRRLKGEAEDVSKLGWAEMLSFQVRAQLKEDFWSASKGVGIAARNVTHHVKSQLANLFIGPNTVIEQFGVDHRVAVLFEGFESSSSGGSISLSNRLDKVGNKISNTLAQFVSGFIDVVNDPYIFSLNLNPVTANAWFFLTRVGVPLKSMSLYFNQPIIDTYLEDMAINRSKFLTAAGKESTIRDIIEGVKQKYISKRTVPKGYVSQDTSEKKDVMFSDSMLTEMVGFEGGKGLTNEQLDMQLQVLNNLLMYMAIGNELGTVITATSQDTTSPKNRHEARIMAAEFEKASTSGIFKNFDQLFKNSFMEEFKKVGQESEDMFSELFLVEGDRVKLTSGLKDIQDIFTNTELKIPQMEKVKALRTAENDFITMLLQTTKIDDKILSDRASDLLQGKNSIPSRILALKRKGRTNAWIEALTPLLSVNRSGPLATTDAMQLIVQSLDTYTQDMLLDAFSELRVVAPRLANDIIDFSILQSGLSQSTVSFTSILPAQLVAERILKVFKVYNASNSNATLDFYNKFFKNNWDNPSIVPTVKANKAVLPAVSEFSANAKYPYVTIMVPAVNKEVENELRALGHKIPRQKLLFKKIGFSDPTAIGIRFIKYAPVSKFGNGRLYKEYRPGVEPSMIEQNIGHGKVALELRSAQTAIKAPKELTAKMQEFIMSGTKRSVSLPDKTLTKSGLYKSELGTFVLELSKTNFKVGDLKSLAAKIRFAATEGYKSWDTLVKAISKGYNTIPAVWLKGKAGVKVFKVRNVEKTVGASNAELKIATTVAFAGPRLEGLDGENTKGPIYEAVEREMSEMIEDLISDGNTDFIVGGAEGTDIMTAKLLLMKQLKRRHINIHAVIPYEGYEASVKDSEDAKWYAANILSRYSSMRKHGNTVSYARKGVAKDWKEAAGFNHSRNKAVVAKAGTVVGVWSEGQAGGTGNVVGYTKEKSREFKQIDLADIRERVRIENEDKVNSQKCN